MRAELRCLATAALLLAIAGARAQSLPEKEVLVLLEDLSLRASHSIFFGDLRSQGFNLHFRSASDKGLKLRDWDDWLYGKLVVFASALPGASLGACAAQRSLLGCPAALAPPLPARPGMHVHPCAALALPQSGHVGEQQQEAGVRRLWRGGGLRVHPRVCGPGRGPAAGCGSQGQRRAAGPGGPACLCHALQSSSRVKQAALGLEGRTAATCLGAPGPLGDLAAAWPPMQCSQLSAQTCKRTWLSNPRSLLPACCRSATLGWTWRGARRRPTLPGHTPCGGRPRALSSPAQAMAPCPPCLAARPPRCAPGAMRVRRLLLAGTAGQAGVAQPVCGPHGIHRACSAAEALLQRPLCALPDALLLLQAPVLYKGAALSLATETGQVTALGPASCSCAFRRALCMHSAEER